MLQALPALAQLGLPEVPRPLPSLSGSLHQPLGDAILVVFEHVEGERVDAASVDPQLIANLLARLHRLPHAAAVARETFHWPHAPWWPDAVRRAQLPSIDPHRVGLRMWLEAHTEHLDAAWRRLHELGATLRTAGLEFVLTHGDWPFNLLQSSDGSLHLVDWDELMLAPRERDTWFASLNQDFVRAYDGPSLNEQSTAFYFHSRYFEDLVGLLLIVFGQHDRHSPAEAVTALDNVWMTGLRERIDRFAGSR